MSDPTPAVKNLISALVEKYSTKLWSWIKRIGRKLK